MTRWPSSPCTTRRGQLAALRSLRLPAVRFGRLATFTITILSIAGTLSGCGRYGSPVRVDPAVSVLRTETLESEAIAPAADESSDRKDADHETDRTD